MKKKILIGIGAVLMVALLAGAAFMAVRLLNSRAADGIGSLITGLGNPGSGGASFAMKIEMTPAPEVPITRADLVGQVFNIKDNSLFVSDMARGGGAEGQTVVIAGGAVTSGGPSTTDNGPTATPSGPLTEVVVSKETLIYRDASMDNIPKPSDSGGSVSVQQKVSLVDITQITPNSMVQVWGQKRGDRLIADTIVVMGLGVIEMKSGGGN